MMYTQTWMHFCVQRVCARGRKEHRQELHTSTRKTPPPSCAHSCLHHVFRRRTVTATSPARNGGRTAAASSAPTQQLRGGQGVWQPALGQAWQAAVAVCSRPLSPPGAFKRWVLRCSSSSCSCSRACRHTQPQPRLPQPRCVRCRLRAKGFACAEQGRGARWCCAQPPTGLRPLVRKCEWAHMSMSVCGEGEDVSEQQTKQPASSGAQRRSVKPPQAPPAWPCGWPPWSPRTGATCARSHNPTTHTPVHACTQGWAAAGAAALGLLPPPPAGGKAPVSLDLLALGAPAALGDQFLPVLGGALGGAGELV